MADPIGEVTSLSGAATAAAGDAVRDLGVGDPIFANDEVLTAQDSALEIRFADSTTLSLGAESRMVIDEYVYSPQGDQSPSAIFDIGPGVFRLITGEVVEQDPAALSVTTPLAVIGIRGTTLQFYIEPARDGMPGHERVLTEHLTLSRTVYVRDHLGQERIVTFTSGKVLISPDQGLGLVEQATARELLEGRALAPAPSWDPDNPLDLRPGDNRFSPDDAHGEGQGSLLGLPTGDAEDFLGGLDSRAGNLHESASGQAPRSFLQVGGLVSQALQSLFGGNLLLLGGFGFVDIPDSDSVLEIPLSTAPGSGGDDYIIEVPEDPPVVTNLFSEGNDIVDFNTVLAGTYPEGTQYDALGGDDQVTLPDVANADAAGFVIGEYFTGGDGNDIIQGGDGNDYIDGGNGQDSLDGGAGYDICSFASAMNPVTINLGATPIVSNNGDGGTENPTNFERWHGSASADTLNGSAGNDDLHGMDGNDTLNGNAGNDILDGGRGDDDITGGEGADSMTGGDGNDEFFYGASTEAATGESVDGGAGTDTITILAGTSYDMTGLSISNIEALDANITGLVITFSGAQVTGQSWALTGSATTRMEVQGATGSANTIDLGGMTSVGWNGSLRIIGGTAADTLTASTTVGTYIHGGGGGDTMTAGGGADVFAYTTPSDGGVYGAHDVITGFDAVSDRIELNSANFNSISLTNFTSYAGGGEYTGSGASTGVTTFALVFDNVDDVLYYDVNGDDPGGAQVICDLAEDITTTNIYFV